MHLIVQLLSGITSFISIYYASFAQWRCLSALNFMHRKSFPVKTSLGGIRKSLVQQIFPFYGSIKF